MTLRIRPAQLSDQAFLAWVMLESTLPGRGRGIFDSALEGTGTTPIAFHQALLKAGASNWGQLEDFVILEDNGQSLGAASAYRPDGEDLRPLTAGGFRKLLGQLDWPQETAREFWRRYATLFGLFGNSPQLAQPADYVIEYVALTPEQRGRGLVRLLLDVHAERARKEGCTRLGISAVAGNEAALAAYRKYGFLPHQILSAADFGGAFPGITRLMLPLRPAPISSKKEDVVHGTDL